MYRLGLFLAGATIASLALPGVLDHHARAEIMKLAWCSSTGASTATTGFLGMHCPACPALLSGLAMMVLAPFANPLRRVAMLRLSK